MEPELPKAAEQSGARAEPPTAAEPAMPEAAEAPVLPAEATPATASLELEWRRLHPLSPLLRGGLFLIVIAGILITNLRDRIFELFISEQYFDADGGDLLDLVDYLAGQRMLIWVLLGVLALVLLIVGFSWLSWRFSTFRITGEAVESRRGVVVRQHRRAPLERIQSVNLQRSLLARLLGLTQLDVQTAGQGGKVDLQYLGHRDAKQVREQILLAAGAAGGGAARASVGATAGAAAPAGGLPEASGAGAVPLSVDFSGHIYGQGAGTIDARLRDAVDFDIDPSARERGSLIKVPVARLIASILLGSEMVTVLLMVAAVAVSSIWAGPFVLAAVFPLALILVSLLISQFNKGFNFVLSRAADGVRVGAGLTATTTETIPFGRVHAVEALQPIGWRPFGWWKVRMTTAGHSLSQGGQNKLQNIVLPVGDLDDVLRVFETLLHDGEHGADGRRAALRYALIGDGRGFLRAGRGAGWVLWFGRRRAGLRIENSVTGQASLRVRRGWLTRSLAVMPVLRAQSLQLSRPFAHRALGLATLQAHTVLGPVRIQMRGIGLEDARQAFDVLAETVVRVQGAEAAARAETHASSPAEPSSFAEPAEAAEPGRHTPGGDCNDGA